MQFCFMPAEEDRDFDERARYGKISRTQAATVSLLEEPEAAAHKPVETLLPNAAPHAFFQEKEQFFGGGLVTVSKLG